MAREFFCCFHSYRKKCEKLSDQEVGRLFRALMQYSETGERQELTGRESIAFDFIAEDIDSSRKAYEARCEQNRKNVLQRHTGVNDGIRTSTKSTKQKKETKSESETKPENTPPLPPSLGGCGAELNAVFTDWLAYKGERRQGYKPTGLRTLISRIETAARQHGERAVADLIRDCIANGWQGIAWDKLNTGGSAGGRPVNDRNRIRAPEEYKQGGNFFDD